YIDARTRHDIPLREGFEALNFEFGTRKFAVGGNISSDYLLHDKVDFSSLESNESDTKQRSGHNSSNSLQWEANLKLKWVSDQNNYFAGTFLSKGKHAKKWTEDSGTYNALPLLSNAKETAHNGGMLGAVYYEHSFSDDNKITAYANYNYGYYNEEDRQTDKIGYDSTIDHMISNYWEYEKSRRNQSTSFLDFEGTHFSAGNKFVYTQDKLRDMTTTPNDFAQVITQSNYTYLTYDNNWKDLYYMASAGLQYMKIKTPDGHNNWFRPRISASLTYRLNPRDYLRLYYQLNSLLPSSSELFTFNHSTNPWLRIEGNPYLTPQQVNTVSAEYRKNFSPFMLQISAATNLYSNMIEAVILSDGQQAISTFQNNGNYIGLTTFARLNYTTRKLQASLTTAYYGEKFHSTGYLPSVALRGYAKWDIGNWYVYGDIIWKNRSYSAISQTRQLNPSQAIIQVGWYATNELRISVAMPYFWGIREVKTITKSPNYSDITTFRYKSESLRPWLLITYTIRRNAREAISNRMPEM
ncbi:MAG: TonB-dependent receptor, partial [Muribaculaceae bacterium]|nr:TonB-dependent receptor [Muribaculaceae bacterium]